MAPIRRQVRCSPEGIQFIRGLCRAAAEVGAALKQPYEKKGLPGEFYAASPGRGP